MSGDSELIATKVPPSLYERIEKKVEEGNFLSVADFVRQSVREKLEREGE